MRNVLTAPANLPGAQSLEVPRYERGRVRGLGGNSRKSECGTPRVPSPIPHSQVATLQSPPQGKGSRFIF